MDCIAHGVAKSLTQVSDFQFTHSFPTPLIPIPPTTLPSGRTEKQRNTKWPAHPLKTCMHTPPLFTFNCKKHEGS